MADLKLPKDLQDELVKLNIEVAMCCIQAGIAVCKYIIAHPEMIDQLPDNWVGKDLLLKSRGIDNGC